jgi:ubiquinone biosynthesis protein
MVKRRGITLRGLARAPHRIRRLAKIARVLTRHGFGHVAHHLPFQRFVPAAARVLRRPVTAKVERISIARRLSMALEELGPTYVKLGQLLSTRPDIIPEEYVVELARLQDKVSPFPSRKAYEIIERELHRPVRELFAEIAQEPLAAGSIAQVYLARLPGGEEVVVKVKRPGIERIVQDDLDLLMLAAERFERVEQFQAYRPVMLLEEFSKSLAREMDFVTEASYTEKFVKAFEGDERVQLPAVHWDYTTPSVLTLGRVNGISIGRTQELRQMGVNTAAVARHLASVFMKQYFEMGLFHADPHPGNLLVAEDGRVGIVDFGIVGHLDEELRRDLGTGLVALVRKDLDLVVDVATEIGAVPDEADLGRLKSEMVEMLDKYYGIPVKRVDMKRAFADLMRVTREHGLIWPRDFVLLGKSFVTIAGLTMALDPDLSMVEVVRPYAQGVLREKLSPARVVRGVMDQVWHVSNLLRRLPRELRQFSRKALAGKLQVTLKLRGMEEVITELDKATNRIASSLIIAAVVIGSSIIIHAKMPPLFRGLPVVGQYLPELSVIGFAGYLLAGVLGMVLVVAIWRSGKL